MRVDGLECSLLGDVKVDIATDAAGQTEREKETAALKLVVVGTAENGGRRGHFGWSCLGRGRQQLWQLKRPGGLGFRLQLPVRS